MLIAKRHPTMKRAVHSEQGVMGTYAATVIAAIGLLVSAGLFLGKTGPAGEGEVASASAPNIAARADAAPQAPARSKQAEVSGAKQASDWSIRAAGVEEADQPVYDESAGMLIGGR